MPSITDYLAPIFGGTNLGGLKDFQHASRLYLDNVYSLAPKNSWIYYVVFDIDPSAITETAWANKQRVSEVGMLVKRTSLPKFTIDTETVNQYNKKTVVQKKITYDQINMTFHDDMSNVVHKMWTNYFRYYYADGQWAGTGAVGTAKDTMPSKFQKGNQFDPPSSVFGPTDFGMNSSNVNAPFFRSITIYQLNRKVFTSYMLINPLITRWEHDELAQGDINRVAENKMSIAYETVLYGEGLVKKDNPTGFAVFHYDNGPSPLSIAGGGNTSLFGPGGIIAGATEIFGDVSGMMSPDSNVSSLDILGTAIKGVNVLRNVKGVTKDSLRAEGYKVVTDAIKKIGNGGQNGLGLDLNKGNNYIDGEFKGTPLSLLKGAASGQETSGVTTKPPTETAAPMAEVDLNAATSALVDQADYDAQSAALLENFPTEEDESSPDDAEEPDQTYFDIPQPPLDIDEPYTGSDHINDDSSDDEIQAALDNLNQAHANDLDYLHGQDTPNQVISDAIGYSGDPKEASAISKNATAVKESIATNAATINVKYETERSRLESILNYRANNTTGNSTLQSALDPSAVPYTPPGVIVAPPEEPLSA